MSHITPASKPVPHELWFHMLAKESDKVRFEVLTLILTPRSNMSSVSAVEKKSTAEAGRIEAAANAMLAVIFFIIGNLELVWEAKVAKKFEN